MQEALFELRGLHLDELGEPEDALEGPGRNALIKNLGRTRIRVGMLLALDGQGVFLGLDGEVRLRKSSNRDGHAIGIVASPLDIVGRIGVAAILKAGRLVKQREQAVEADGGTIKRGKVKRAHSISSCEA